MPDPLDRRSYFGLVEEMYSLTPRDTGDPTVRLAVTRLSLPTGASYAPVVLLHGSFSNRGFWMSPRGVGLGPYLAGLGFDVWIPEMRGHGASARNRHYFENTVAAYAAYDLPAIADLIHVQNAREQHWLGHSLGGITLAAALGGGYLGASRVASAALLGAQISRIYWPLKVPLLGLGLDLLSRPLPVVPGVRLKRGPENEPMSLFREALSWHVLWGRFGDARRDWWAGLTDVQMPVLGMAGSADHQDPAWACRKLWGQFGGAHKVFLELGCAHGFLRDYGHVDMLISRSARLEVWPRIAQWLGCLEGVDLAALSTGDQGQRIGL